MPENDDEKNGEGLDIKGRVRSILLDYLGYKTGEGPEVTTAWKARKEQGPGFWGADIGVKEDKKKK